MFGGMRISVVIFVYNEEKWFLKVFERIFEFVDEVIVVDDGLFDNIYFFVFFFFEKDFWVKVFRFEKNCGKGCVMREGIKYIIGDIVVFMDVDG